MGQAETKFLTSSVQAIKTGNEVKLKDLLSHFKEFIDSHDTEGNTLLIIAVINVQVNIVKMLLHEGADVNAPDTRGMTALHYAVVAENEAIVQMLVAKGSYLNGRNDNFETPLSVAVAQRNVNIVNILLLKHANVNISDAFGNTPLHSAATLGFEEIVTSLLENAKDLDLDAKNVEEYTPLMLALKNGFQDIALSISDHGGDPSIAGSDGVPPLVVAVQMGYVSVIQNFIKRDVDVNAGDTSGNTPLIVSIDAGNEEISLLLIESGASTTVDGCTRSPLHRAVEKGQKKVVCALLEHGADLQNTDPHGSTPFIVAVKHNLGDLVTLLIERGASKDDLQKGMRMAASRGHKDSVQRILSVFSNDDVLSFLMNVGAGLGDGGERIDDDKTCAVCMENSRDAVAVPCGHSACCYECMDGLPSPRLCPICRVEVKIVQKIYRI